MENSSSPSLATGQDPLSLSSEKLSDMPDCGWPLSHIWQRGLCCGKHAVMKQAEISRQTLCVPPCASMRCRGCILLVWVHTAGLCGGGGVCVEVGCVSRRCGSSIHNPPSGQFSSYYVAVKGRACCSN